MRIPLNTKGFPVEDHPEPSPNRGRMGYKTSAPDQCDLTRGDDHYRLRTSDRMDILTPDPTSVYKYYDRHGILLYVGITSRGISRNREHNATKEWWPFVASQTVEHFPTRDAALAHERLTIQRRQPPFNKQHNRAYSAIRSAYLMFAAAQSQPVDLKEELRNLDEKRLPLEVHEHTERSLKLRSFVGHAAIASALTMPPGDLPQAYGFRSRSRVLSVDHIGPLAVVTLSKDASWPVLDAWASVKYETKEDRAVLRNVTVRVDHERRERDRIAWRAAS